MGGARCFGRTSARIQSGLPRARAACAAAAPCRLPARPSPRVAYALLSTRQYPSVFNQPLSFDTSSVTSMDSMFYVRSAPALPSRALVRPSLCATLAPPPLQALPPPQPAPRPRCIACTPFDSAGRVGVQPATELRHVQRHEHAQHVQRTLTRARARVPSLESAPPRESLAPPPLPYTLPPS